MTRTNGNGDGATAVHIALQGKGGVGKSLVSAILSQYLASKGQDVLAIDADPVNHTLAEYRGLAVSELNLLKEGSVDQREVDLLMERFLTENGTFIVDTGASTFIPLWHYILENDALKYLREKGKSVFIHSVITGGQSLNDTLSGFEQLAETTRERNLADKVHGSVAIVRRTADTFGRDVEEMIGQKMTFQEALNDNSFTIMAKQRLRVVQRELFSQLDAIPLVQ